MPSDVTTSQIREVDAATAQQWLACGDADLVDVRERDEHAREHIAGATLVPLSSFKTEQLPTNEGRKVVVHCRSGRRSLEAAAQLAQTGQYEVYSLKGGIEAWSRSGLPTEVNRRAPIPIMRQVQIVAGSLILIGTLLGAFISPWWLILSGFVGAGLVFAGVSGFCGMANILALLPFNRITVCEQD